VLADDVTIAVPAYCTAALGLAAAAIAAAGASAGSTSAVETASAVVLLQPVDQLLLLPGLPHSRLRAELLQLRDGLRGQTEGGRVSRIERRAVSCGEAALWTGERDCGRQQYVRRFTRCSCSSPSFADHVRAGPLPGARSGGTEPAGSERSARASKPQATWVSAPARLIPALDSRLLAVNTPWCL
jgi:hypothetical protein